MLTTLFKNGGSQAMRIPAQYRFEGDSVECEWDYNLNALIVRDNPNARLKAFFDAVSKIEPSAEVDFYPVDETGRFDVVAFFNKVVA